MEIFNKQKSIKANYIINLDSVGLINKPLGIFPNIIPYSSNKLTGCPAVSSVDKRVHKIISPFTVEIIIYKQNDVLVYDYKFDDTTLKDAVDTHELLQTMFFIPDTKLKHFQITTPYSIVTDNKDLELTVLPPSNVETTNLEFVIGAFKPYGWVRNINPAYKLIDENKQATIKYKLNDEMFMLSFNKPVDLSYADMSVDVINYYNHSKQILSIRSKIKDIYKTVLSRRPKKLL